MNVGPALVCPGCGSPDVDLRRGLLCGTCAEATVLAAAPCPCNCPCGGPCGVPAQPDDDGTPGWCDPCRMNIHQEA